MYDICIIGAGIAGLYCAREIQKKMPGATEQQWGYARVHSFLLCGKTYKTTDSDLVRKASNRSKKAAKWWKNYCSSSSSSK